MPEKSNHVSADAIDLLVADHEKVKKLFKEFDQLKDRASAADKQELVEQICDELMLHTEAEEEIFYPAARAALKDEDMFNEAEVEHASAKDLIAQLAAMDPSDEMYDAKVTVLSEYIEHHVGEEEKEMFPAVRKAGLDLEQLGAQMQDMKEKRKAQGIPMPALKNPAAGSSAHR